MNTLKGKLTMALFSCFVLALSISACSSESSNELTEEEKTEILLLEESADKLDSAVEELDSAVKELDQIDEILK